MPKPAPPPVLTNQAKTIANGKMLAENQPRQIQIIDVNGNASARVFPNQANAEAWLIQNSLGISEVNG